MLLFFKVVYTLIRNFDICTTIFNTIYYSRQEIELEIKINYSFRRVLIASFYNPTTNMTMSTAAWRLNFCCFSIHVQYIFLIYFSFFTISKKKRTKYFSFVDKHKCNNNVMRFEQKNVTYTLFFIVLLQNIVVFIVNNWEGIQSFYFLNYRDIDGWKIDSRFDIGLRVICSRNIAKCRFDSNSAIHSHNIEYYQM